MSPPSLATAGRTRVSIRSLICATVSAAASLKNSPPSSASSSLWAEPSASSGARRAGYIVLHDGAEDRRFELLPVALSLGHGDEVRAEEHAGDFRHLEQARGERRAVGGFAAGKFHRAAVEHDSPGDELQGCGIGRSFGLDEHGFLRRRRFKAGA